MRKSDYVWSYLTILPFVIIFLSLTVWPIIRTIQFSLYNYNWHWRSNQIRFCGDTELHHGD